MISPSLTLASGSLASRAAPGAGFSPSCMSSSGFNLHHFSIMTEQVIAAAPPTECSASARNLDHKTFLPHQVL